MKGERQAIWQWACTQGHIGTAEVMRQFPSLTRMEASRALAEMRKHGCFTRKRGGIPGGAYIYVAIRDCPPPGSGTWQRKKQADTRPTAYTVPPFRFDQHSALSRPERAIASHFELQPLVRIA